VDTTVLEGTPEDKESTRTPHQSPHRFAITHLADLALAAFPTAEASVPNLMTIAGLLILV